MTAEMMSLRGVLEKSADADLLREMIGFAAERLKKGAIAAFSGDLSAPVKALNEVGLIGVAAVQERMTYGTFAPLSERTLAARRARGRTGEKPLIDTAQMRRVVTYSILNKGQGE
ncbi:hypothetical protein MKK75_25360 [Methylobacterium sp. J-030]|nr:hypothetical protein [Methylobacterium sp. J-030]MCJ2072087.1 hypothetical protein [Methylobacterium sp. J-030]